MIAGLLLGCVPFLSIQAADHNHYPFSETNHQIRCLDLTDEFAEYDGSFVLYDPVKDTWMIYQMENATTRIAPASTYKIYDSLFSLDAGIITPEQSLLPWNEVHYPYDLWNTDQTLASVMQHSVTWYFQALDQQSDLNTIRDYIQNIGYGNQLAFSPEHIQTVKDAIRLSSTAYGTCLRTRGSRAYTLCPL